MYLDPGTSATLMQLALAGFAGLAAFAKLRMNAMKRRIGKAERGKSKDPSESLVEGPSTTE